MASYAFWRILGDLRKIRRETLKEIDNETSLVLLICLISSVRIYIHAPELTWERLLILESLRPRMTRQRRLRTPTTRTRTRSPV